MPEDIWICEQHYWQTWPHDDCPGPGVLLSSIKGWWQRIETAEAKIREVAGFVKLAQSVPSLKAQGLDEVGRILNEFEGNGG